MNLQLSELKGFKASNLFRIATFLLVFLVGFSFNAEAQKKKPRSSKDKVEDYFDEDGFGSHKLWYGGGVGLNFGGGGASSQFNFALSPMVGYKITDKFSIGPRGELDYSHIRVGSGASREKYNLLNYAIGGFARYKVINPFFAHVEYQIESRAGVDGFGETIRGSRNNFFVGGGYGSGGGLIGYEISILYNVIDDGSSDIPLDYRIAFTYNF